VNTDADLSTLIEEGYRRAEEMLRPTPYPDSFPDLPKLSTLDKSAQHLGAQERFHRPPIHVTFADGINHVGIEQKTCALCGDCISGCNHWAKNSTLMNYLPDAWNHGAEIFTEVSVRSLERKDGKWIVHYQPVAEERKKFGAPDLFVTAEVVILAAGTLGTSEILLRSKANGLPISDRAGHDFTGNGDVIAFAYNCDEEINAIGFGHHEPGQISPVGPSITGMIDNRHATNVNEGFVIEESAIPGAIGGMLPVTLGLAAKAFGKDTDSGLADWLEEKTRATYSLLRGPYHGAIRNTQIYLAVSHDSGKGRLLLEDDRLRISWPGVGDEPQFENINAQLLEATRPLGGIFVKNPIWSAVLRNSLITTHPMGGCVMAERAESNR